jgi:hypothetical protein
MKNKYFFLFFFSYSLLASNPYKLNSNNESIPCSVCLSLPVGVNSTSTIPAPTNLSYTSTANGIGSVSKLVIAINT